MNKSVYARRNELYRGWTRMYNVDTISMSFEDFQNFMK